MNRLLAVWPPATLGLLSATLMFFAPVPLALALGAFAILMVLDARARLLEYKRCIYTMAYGGGVTMLCWRHRTSWCQREMVKAAASTFGLLPDVERVFHDWGYRWYHFFPDNTFSRDCPFLTVGFWRSLVGLPRTRSVPQRLR